MKSMFLSFIFSSLLYVNLFADGCCSSCNSCKKPTHTDSGSYKQGTHSGLGNHKPGLHTDTDSGNNKPVLQLNITRDNIKLNNNVIQQIPVDNIPKYIISDEYKSNITFYELIEEQFNSNIIPTVNLGNDTQYIIAKIETIEKKYYLLKIIIENTGTDEDPESKADSVFKTFVDSIVTEIIILSSSENISSLESIFDGCKNLTYVDLSNLNTQNVTNMSNMFYNCENLTMIVGLSSLNTRNVTDMSLMFLGCNSLTTLDLSGFNTKNVTSMYNIFKCNNLKKIYVTEKDNTNLITVVKKNFVKKECKFNDKKTCITITEKKESK